ncbi:MAG: ATP-binding protein [Nocardioides sp.]|uniref:ATP-binding protein n=1 Tax=Nocardioides sp. TaxID=35761 RepID=UPI003F0D3D63
MPLSSRLPLEASPRSAQQARRWVGGICRQLERDDLVDAAELGTSELVTNAVLHGAEPIVVMVRGTASHPRVEVHDGSAVMPDPPVPVSEDAELDDLLTTFGRGLAIVARCSSTWGATNEATGKVVWFEPTAEERDDVAEGVIDDVEDADPEPVSDAAVPVVLRGFDLELMARLARQYAELRRELRLLALAHHDAYPLASDLSAMFVNYERQFPREFHDQVAEASAAGERRINLTMPASPEAAPIFSTMVDMFDLADAFCRAERLLSLERSPRERAFHTWMLTEIVAQLEGEQATTWEDVDPSSHTPQPVA